MKKTQTKAFANLVAAIILLVFEIWAYVQTLGFKIVKKAAVQPATFPQIMCIGMMVFTVILLILPYLLLGNAQYITALVCMLLVVVLIIAGFTYYTSVAMDQPFKSRFLEMALISIGVAVVSFFVGILAKQLLGVDL